MVTEDLYLRYHLFFCAVYSQFQDDDLRFICGFKIMFVHLRIEKEKMSNSYTKNEEQIARFAKALGHPARIAILNFLASQESCFFGAIHEVLPIAKATVSQHLSELKDAGLIQGEIMPPKVKYCINAQNWALAKQLIGDFMKECNPKDGCCK